MSINTDKNQPRKLRVLACAYACLLESGSPISGGEATLGWNLVRQLARFHDVWVLTATSNRKGIEGELKRQPVANVTFHFVDLPGWMQPLAMRKWRDVRLTMRGGRSTWRAIA